MQGCKVEALRRSSMTRLKSHGELSVLCEQSDTCRHRCCSHRYEEAGGNQRSKIRLDFKLGFLQHAGCRILATYDASWRTQHVRQAESGLFRANQNTFLHILRMRTAWALIMLSLQGQSKTQAVRFGQIVLPHLSARLGLPCA